MRHVTCRVPEDAVYRIAGKGWRMGWRGLRSRFRANDSANKFPRARKIWFPYFLYTFEVTSRKGPGTMCVSVEAWSGAFAIFQLEEYLLENPVDTSEVLPARLSMEEGEAHARHDLLHTIMRQRTRIGGKPLPGNIVDREQILYPLWVYYYERKGNFIDIKLVDGATGRLMGHRTRGAVLDAFLAKNSGDAEAPPDEKSGVDLPE